MNTHRKNFFCSIKLNIRRGISAGNSFCCHSGNHPEDYSKKQERRERGSIAILLALSMTVLLGCCALVTDLGLVYVKKAQLQNSVDAAALAGAQELPGNPALAEQTAQDYAGRNGAQNISVAIGANVPEITVQAFQNVPAYFAHIWGISQEQISASAKAIMVPPGGLSGAVPFSIQDQPLAYGQEYTLKSGAGEGESGWYGVLDLSLPGASNYEIEVANGYSGTLSIGQILSVENGNMSGPTLAGVNDRLSRDTDTPKNTFDDYRPGAPEIIYVPVVKILNGSQVQIVGFAAFFLEGVAGNGNNSIVTGRFIQTIVPNGQTSGSLSDLTASESAMENGQSSTDFGLYSPKLVEN